MSTRTDIRDDAAEVFKQALDDTVGETITYSHKGDAGISLTSAPFDLVVSQDGEFGAQEQAKRRAFAIPRQTAFPPTNGVAIDDKITFDSIDWYVESWSVDSLGAVFTLNTVEHQTHKIGTGV